MYTLEFGIDKACAAIYEAIAIVKIEEWYRSQGHKIHARYNEENGLQGKRGYDLVDSYGNTWEVKADRLWGVTGNILFEHQAAQHSQADYYVILAGFAYVLPRQTVLDLLAGDYRVVRGGDGDRATGTLIPVEELKNVAFVI